MHLAPASCRAITVNYTSTRGITSLFRRVQFWWRIAICFSMLEVFRIYSQLFHYFLLSILFIRVPSNVNLQVRCRYCRITRAGFYSFARLRIPNIKNDEIYCSACAITTRKDYGSENHSAFVEIRGRDRIWIFIGTVFMRDIPGSEQRYKVCRRSPPRLASRYKSSA